MRQFDSRNKIFQKSISCLKEDIGKISHIKCSWRKQVRQNYEVEYWDSLRNKVISYCLVAVAVNDVHFYLF